jgi:hypothetical protein
MSIFAFGPEVAIAFAEPHLGLPADGLERGGALLQAQWEMTADLGWISIGPGPFAQGATGMRIACLGKTALLPPRPTRLCRGCEPQIMHELSGVIEARQGTQFGHGGHRHRALDTAQGLESLDDRR